MGKWLSNLITPLIILLATTVVTALFKGPIDEMANQSRIKADIELAPWFDKEEKRRPADDLSDAADALTRRIVQSTGNIGVVRINLENGSGKKVSNIRFEMPAYSVTDGVLINDKGEVIELVKFSDIKLSDMEPGDKATVFLWGAFYSYKLGEEFKSYSSEGKFRTTFYWAEEQSFEGKSDIDEALTSFIWIAGSSSTFLLLLIFAIGWTQHSEFIKLILTYPKAYEMEKRRFWQDPRKFNPDWGLLTDKHYKPHALLGDPEPAESSAANTWPSAAEKDEAAKLKDM